MLFIMKINTLTFLAQKSIQKNRFHRLPKSKLTCMKFASCNSQIELIWTVSLFMLKQ